MNVLEPAMGEPETGMNAAHRALLLDVTEALVMATPSRAELARAVFERVSGPLGLDVCFNYEVNEGGLDLVAGFGIPEAMQPAAQHLALGQAFCGTVAATRKHLTADRSTIDADPRGAFVREMGVGAYMCHPLLSRDGRLLGTLSLASTRRSFISRAESDFLQTLCHYVALAWEQVASEDARGALEGQLRQSQRLSVLGALASGIAHDFNNVLSTILGNAELARLPDMSQAERDECLEQIVIASHRARGVIQHILDSVRPGARTRSRASLANLMSETAKLLERMIATEVQLQVSADPGTPDALVDPAQVHQVLMNLCINACQAFEPGQKGHIELASRGVLLDDAQAQALAKLSAGRYAVVEVRDDGKGIDSAVLPHIFEPFFTTKAPGVGTGLGLSVVQGILREHGGAITVQSAPGKGTTFSLYFPAAPGPAS